MALLSSCFCVSLLVGTFIAGAYATITYLAAFAIELWWIIESTDSLEVPAYVLCAGYFIIFFMSVLMLAGVMGKKTRYVLAWLFIMVILFLPETGMVLYMSIKYWTLEHPHGQLELIFWICRALINILSCIVVQSQYTTWRDEKQVMKRLQSLNMTSVITDTIIKEVPVSNGHLGGGYENLAFTSATDMRPLGNGNATLLASDKMHRSVSSASQMHFPRQTSTIGGSLPSNQATVDYDWRRMQPLNAASLAYSDRSEFDASIYGNGSYYPFPVKTQSEISLEERQQVDLQSYRPRSLMYLDEDDYMTRPPPSRAVSLGYINVHPDYSTQSLDRTHYLRRGSPRRAASLEALDMRAPRPDIHLQKVAMKPFDYLNRPGSKHSSAELDSISDDAHHIGDVAL